MAKVNIPYYVKYKHFLFLIKKKVCKLPYLVAKPMLTIVFICPQDVFAPKYMYENHVLLN